MTRQPETGAAEPDPLAAQADPRGWTHHHLFFVLAVLTGDRSKIGKIYKIKKVHFGKIGGGIESWGKADETLAIEEGRRQLDGQVSELRDVIRRASVLLTVGLAAAAYFGTGLEGLGDIAQPWQTIARILLSVGSVLAGWGALVMVALIGDRAPSRQTDAVQLTSEPGDLRKYLARDYAENVPTGVDTNAARVTHLGTGTIWIAIGVVLGVIGIAVSTCSAPPSPCADTSTNPETCLDSYQTTGAADPDHAPPAEFEATGAARQPDQHPVGTQSTPDPP